jgi:tRNA pseudouridine32 synthase/23S rRNA pseudouridine746 synthase
VNPPFSADLQVLHTDAGLIAVDKPSGLLSVPGRGELAHDSAVQRLALRHPEVKVVHRLDMATSGLLLFARGLAAQRVLSQRFAAREVRKGYVAVVDSLVGPDEGEIDAPLMADWPRRPRQKVDWVQGKPSLTRFRVLGRDAVLGTTRLALAPVTGRSHQLRVHLLHLGHPILGDTLYAAPEVAQRAARLLLHAESIDLCHPDTGEALALRCEAPF